ncbi:MAG: epoxyqueuosine reductase QueH [Lachnospiraceae bacterium]|nr:epoxyqueuosine reductase QueH [Lachnospiraceae bacterium]
MNRRNYQKELDDLLQYDKQRGITPSLLLHVCCAPCSSYVQEYLSEHFKITLYFYNPNMDTKEEYVHRETELKRLVKDAGFPSDVIICEYDSESFTEMAKGMEELPEGGRRCYSCYEMRMRKAAEYAKKNGFDYFTTTLSISPYKNAGWINEIGERLAEEYGIKHLPSDFKKKNGYKRSIELSGEYDLYRQDYCGCAISKKEAEGRKERQRARHKA